MTEMRITVKNSSIVDCFRGEVISSVRTDDLAKMGKGDVGANDSLAADLLMF